jgi:hypothetical protein
MEYNRQKHISKRTFLTVQVLTQLDSEKVSEVDRLRLVWLYALRYEKGNPRLLAQLMTKINSRPSKYKPAVSCLQT